MQKDFDGRNKEKQHLDNSTRVVHPKPREIWYIKIGINVGREIYGKEGFFRPVLVVSKIGALYFCIALSTKVRNLDYAIRLFYLNAPNNSFIVINQGRIFDMQRFFTRIGIISKYQFADIKNLLRDTYFPRDF